MIHIISFLFYVTVLCIPLLDGVLELGCTKKVIKVPFSFHLKKNNDHDYETSSSFNMLTKDSKLNYRISG